MPRLNTERLLVIIAATNVITAIAALCVAVQVTRLDTGGGNMSVKVSGSVPVHNTQSLGRNVPLEVSVRN